uniref:Radical SAM protein n=1 Tax=Ignisphaera aggregans TaxID=334771 RepID=A0A7J3Z901_9CREN
MDIKRVFEFVKKLFFPKLNVIELPWRVILAITYRCNSRCKICYTWKVYRENPELAKEEMRLEHLKKLFSELGSSILWLHITGGEPFLRDDLAKVIELAGTNCRNLLGIEIPTNGLIPAIVKKRVEEVLHVLKGKVFLNIGISFNGPKQIHEYIRGVKSSWDRAVRTLKELKELQHSYKNLYVFVIYTISTENVGVLQEFYEELLRNGISIAPSEILIDIEHSGVLYHKSDRIEYRKIRQLIVKDLSWILQRYLNERPKNLLMQVYNMFRTVYTYYIIDFIDNPKKVIMPCEALRSTLFIDPYGNVYPCIIWNVTLGNVKNKSLKEILQSNIAISVRKAIRDGKCPNCWTGCEAVPTLITHPFHTLTKYTHLVLNFSTFGGKA